MSPDGLAPDLLHPEEILRAYRAETGYDADLGADSGGPAFFVAALLDFIVFAFGAGGLLLALIRLKSAPDAVRKGAAGFVGKIGPELAFAALALLLVLLGVALANPDRARRRANRPGSVRPSRAYGLFTGLVVGARVRRRMRVQDAEPLDPRDTVVLAPAFAQAAHPLRVWARERLREGDDPRLRAALASLDEPVAAGEDLLDGRREDLRRLRRLLVEEASALDDPALDYPDRDAPSDAASYTPADA